MPRVVGEVLLTVQQGGYGWNNSPLQPTSGPGSGEIGLRTIVNAARG